MMFSNLTGNFFWEIIANEDRRALDAENNPRLINGVMMGATERYLYIWSDLLRDYLNNVESLFHCQDPRSSVAILSSLLEAVYSSLPDVELGSARQVNVLEEAQYALKIKGTFLMAKWMVSRFFFHGVNSPYEFQWEMSLLETSADDLFYANSTSSCVWSPEATESKKVYDRISMGAIGRSSVLVDVKGDPDFETKRPILEEFLPKWLDASSISYTNIPEEV